MVFLAARGLSAGHDSFLLAIRENPAITMGELAGLLNISASSATKIATRLQEMELMRRENSRLDSRQYHAHLTEKGEALTDEIAADQAVIDAELAARLKGKDTERLIKVLDRLERREPVGKKPRKAGKKKAEAKKSDRKEKKKKSGKAD